MEVGHIIAKLREKNAHHSLQLVVDDNLSVINNVVMFRHHGRIAIGRSGSGKVDELRYFVAERYPLNWQIKILGNLNCPF